MTKTAIYFKYQVNAYYQIEKEIFLKDDTFFTDSLAEAREKARDWRSEGFIVKIFRLNEFDGFTIRELKA